jgi:hypothetical protein
LRVYHRRAAFRCAFLWAKGLNTEDVHNEMFPVYGGKCLSFKVVHNCVTNVSLMKKSLKRKLGQSKDFAGFDALIKRWDKCISVGGVYTYAEKCFYQVLISHALCFTSISDLFTDSPS